MCKKNIYLPTLQYILYVEIYRFFNVEQLKQDIKPRSNPYFS